MCLLGLRSFDVLEQSSATIRLSQKKKNVDSADTVTDTVTQVDSRKVTRYPRHHNTNYAVKIIIFPHDKRGAKLFEIK